MQHNNNLDYFKLLLSFLVIAAHLDPIFYNHSPFGWAICNGVSRVAVPCFFTITGYYMHKQLGRPKAMNAKIWNCGKVLAMWSIIYLPFYYYMEYTGRNVIVFFGGFFHLWYISALFMGFWEFLLLRRFIKNNNILLVIGAILLTIGYYSEQTNQYPARIICSGLFIALPYLIVGYYIQQENLIKRLTPEKISFIAILGLLTLALESYLSYQISFIQNIYLSGYLIAPALIPGILKMPVQLFRGKGKYISMLSGGVFYVHVLVLKMLQQGEYNIYVLLPVFIISLLLATFIIYLNKYVKFLL